MARSEYDNGYVGVRQTHNRYINAIRICVSIFCIKRLPTITAAITPTSLADNQQPKNQAVEINKFRFFLQRVYAICNCVIWECTASCKKNETNRNPRVPEIHISKPVSKSTIHKSLLKTQTRLQLNMHHASKHRHLSLKGTVYLHWGLLIWITCIAFDNACLSMCETANIPVPTSNCNSIKFA